MRRLLSTGMVVIGIKTSEILAKFAKLNWLPKLHKSKIYASSSSFTQTKLSKLLTNVVSYYCHNYEILRKCI